MEALVSPGTLGRKPLSSAVVRLLTVGDPRVACAQSTRSAGAVLCWLVMLFICAAMKSGLCRSRCERKFVYRLWVPVRISMPALLWIRHLSLVKWAVHPLLQSRPRDNRKSRMRGNKRTVQALGG